MDLPNPPSPERDGSPNPSLGFMPSENLTDAEIAEQAAWYEREDRLDDLEEGVITAALKLAKTSDDLDHRSEWEANEDALLDATRALLAARAEVVE